MQSGSSTFKKSASVFNAIPAQNHFFLWQVTMSRNTQTLFHISFERSNMVATIPLKTSKVSKLYSNAAVNARYIEMLPIVIKSALIAFAKYSYEARAEAVQNVQVWALYLLHQMAANGKLKEAKASPIAQFAIGRHREGRIAGTPCNSTDVLADNCRYLGRSKIKHFGLAENIADTFESEATVSDARYPVHRAVQFKMDFHEGWLQQQTPRDKKIIGLLATGWKPSHAAQKCGVSPAYVNQCQKRYRASWLAYISDKKEHAKEAA
jgi:hypothetical protein